MTIETDPPKVSPQTHTFIGMFRPPMESILDPKTSEHIVQCPCRSAWWDVHWGHVWHTKGSRLEQTQGDFRREFQEHWLAGHFDIPQYRLIEDTKQIDLQSILCDLIELENIGQAQWTSDSRWDEHRRRQKRLFNFVEYCKDKKQAFRIK